MMRRSALNLFFWVLLLALIYYAVGYALKEAWPGYISVVGLAFEGKIGTFEITPPEFDALKLTASVFFTNALFGIPWIGFFQRASWAGYGTKLVRPLAFFAAGIVIVFVGGVVYNITKGFWGEATQAALETFDITIKLLVAGKQLISMNGGPFSVVGFVVALYVFGKYSFVSKRS